MEKTIEKTLGKPKRLAVLAGIIIAVAITGCASSKNQEELAQRRAIVDDYAAIILLQDQDSANFDKALLAVHAYLADASAEQKTAAQDTIEDMIAQLKTDSAACESYEISKELGQMLEAHQISRVEYQMNADSRYTYLQDYIQDLTYLEEYLSYADEGDAFMEDLQVTYRFMEEEQRLMRHYNFIGINYWFAGWGEEETAYIRQAVLDKLTSFSAQDVQWQDSRDAVEESMNACLDQVEELYNEWTAYIGESWEEQNQMH